MADRTPDAMPDRPRDPAAAEGSLFPAVVETERLRLERFDRAVDAREYYGILADDPDIEEVTRYTPWDPHDHPKETLALVERFAEQWREGEHPSYAIYPRAGEDGAGEFAGAGDVGVDWERRGGELGVWLRKRFWGRGYSGERATALLHLAFDRLDLEMVGVTLRADNEKSRRAVEKYVQRAGGQLDGRFRNRWTDEGGDVHDALRYSVTREGWTANRPDEPVVAVYEDGSADHGGSPGREDAPGEVRDDG